MKLEINPIASGAIEVKIDGGDYSIADIVHMELLELKHVKFAGVAPPHPLIKTVTLQIHTDGADSIKTLAEALESSQTKVRDLLNAARSTFPLDQRPESSSPVALEARTSSTS